MSILAAETLKKTAAVRPPSRLKMIVRVHDTGRHVGDMLIDRRNRVWRHADTIPTDVVMKILIAVSRRDETRGEMFGRGDGRPYAWHVLGGPTGAETPVMNEAREVCDAVA